MRFLFGPMIITAFQFYYFRGGKAMKKSKIARLSLSILISAVIVIGLTGCGVSKPHITPPKPSPKATLWKS